jgi:hypothetical protein
MVSICGVLLIGIEIRCGMIGYGVIMVGTLGVHHTGGHHLDMIDGGIITTDGTTTTDGDTMDTTVMVGITIMVGTTTTDKIIGMEDEEELMCRTSMVEEVRLVMK